MAISGDLNDFSLEEVLKTVRSRTGTLYLYSALGGRSVELCLHKNHLIALFIDGFPINEKTRATGIFTQLLSDSHGRFNFQDGDYEEIDKFFLMPVFSLVTQTQYQREVVEADLPHPQTLFRALPVLPKVPSMLSSPWASAQPLLRQAANAEMLSERLQVPLRDALVMLYRFRSAGLIELAQASAMPPQVVAAAPVRTGTKSITTETRSLLHRLLYRLRRSEAI